MTTLFLVRHGRPLVDPHRQANEWILDPQGIPAIERLRDSGHLPRQARWFSSPEPKAYATARLLTDQPVEVVDDLAEHRRESTEWIEDFATVVESAFARPSVSAWPGWEPLADCRARVTAAVRNILATVENPDDHVGDLVLVGHGTAWTVLISELTRQPPDLDRWRAMAMPDLMTISLDELS